MKSTFKRIFNRKKKGRDERTASNPELAGQASSTQSQPILASQARTLPRDVKQLAVNQSHDQIDRKAKESVAREDIAHADKAEEATKRRAEEDYKTAKGLLKTGLQLASQALQGCPIPLPKAIVDTALEVFTGCEQTSDNAQTTADILATLKGLSENIRLPLQDLSASTSSTELKTRATDLLTELNSISRDCPDPKRDGITRYAQRESDAGDLVGLTKRLNEAMQQFQLISLIRQEAKLSSMDERQRSRDVQDLLDRLRPALKASFQSSRADAIDPCLRGTRVTVLEKLKAWIRDNDIEVSHVFWLSGMAGIGKSAIAKSIADWALENGLLAASFVFSRHAQDAILRNPSVVLPTIAYQLSRFDPDFERRICASLEKRRDIAEENLQSQGKWLLVEPFQGLGQLHTQPLILLDAFDECEGEDARRLLRTILPIILGSETRHPLPFKVLITSRPESYIRNAFRSFTSADRIVLHDIEADVIQHDIELYLETALQKMPQDFETLESSAWFQRAELDALVKRSGKLFIYAATVTRFLRSDPPNNPQRQLKQILAGSTESEEAYATLDGLYFDVLQQARASTVGYKEEFRALFSAIILARDTMSLATLEHLLDLPPGTARSTLATFSSVLSTPPDDSGSTSLYHPSFPEFITDPTRCTDLTVFIDVKQYEGYLASRCLLVLDHDPYFYNKASSTQAGDTTSVPKHLEYSALNWAFHLSNAALGHPNATKVLEEFVKSCLLRWLEILRILNKTSSAVVSARKAEEWAIRSDCAPRLVSLLHDVSRFASTFLRTISDPSIPIHQSALPFCPMMTSLWEVYKGHVSRSVKITRGRLEHWSPCLVVMPGHFGDVNAIAFSPDGSRLASGSSDATVRLWDAWSGATVAKLEGHSDWVRTIKFSSDGSRLASGSRDTTVKLWDVGSGEILVTLKGHSREVYTLAFSPNGLRIASGSDDKTVRLWDTRSGTAMATFKGHSGWVNTLVFSSDGLWLASGSNDKTVRLWDADMGTALATLKGHSGWVYSIALSSDGSRLASGSRDKTVMLWDVESGDAVAKLEGHSSRVNTLAFSSDGKLLASASHDGTVRLWNARSGAASARLKGHSDHVNILAFSPDGLRLASGSHDRTVKLWDIGTGATVATLDGHSGSIYTLAFSSDGSRLASGSSDMTMRLWDTGSGAAVVKLEGHSDRVNTLAFSSDGLQLASASNDKTVRLWDAGSGAPLATLQGHSDHVNTLAFSSDGLRLASGSDDKTVRLWRVSRGSIVAPLTGHSGLINFLAFSPDGLWLATGSTDETVKLWDAESGDALATLEGHSDHINILTFSPDGLWLATGSDDKTVRLWDARSGAAVAKLQGHSDDVYTLAFSPDGLQLASGSRDRTVRLWNTESGAAVATLEGHSGWVRILAFSPDGSRIASGSRDTTVRLWDARSGVALAKLRGHSDSVTTLAYSPDGSRIASGSRDATVRLWEARSGAAVLTLAGHLNSINTLAFSSDGLRLASGSDDMTTRIWETISGAAVATLKGHTGRITILAFSSDGLRLASGSRDKTVRLWDYESGTTVATLEGHSDWVQTLAFSPNGSRLASGSRDTLVRIWDAKSGAAVAKFAGHLGGVNTLAFSSNGMRLASGSDDKTVRIWDTSSAASVATLQGHSDWVRTLTSSEDWSPVISWGSGGGWSQDPPAHNMLRRESQETPSPVLLTPPNSPSASSPLQSRLRSSYKDHWIYAARGSSKRQKAFYIPQEYDVDTVKANGDIVALGCEDGQLLLLDFSHWNP